MLGRQARGSLLPRCLRSPGASKTFCSCVQLVACCAAVLWMLCCGSECCSGGAWVLPVQRIGEASNPGPEASGQQGLAVVHSVLIQTINVTSLRPRLEMLTDSMGEGGGPDV
eukprot:12135213-Alexandrium_andersonii.AAC.1